jgi:hypothetical protein
MFSLLSFTLYGICGDVLIQVVLVMEAGIFLCHWYFLLKAYLRRRRSRGAAQQDEEAPKVEDSSGTGTDSAAAEQDVAEIPLNPIFSSTSGKSGHNDVSRHEQKMETY